MLEVAAHEVVVTVAEQEAPQRRIGRRETLATIAAKERQPADGMVNPRDRGQAVKPLGGIVAQAEEVDHVAFVAQGVCALSRMTAA